MVDPKAQTAKPIVALTMGDPAGIGPEVAVRASADPDIRRSVRPVLVGVARVFLAAAARAGVPLTLVPWGTDPCEQAGASASDTARVEPIMWQKAGSDAGVFQPGTVAAASGRAAWEAVGAAVTLALAGEVDAVVTAPLHKEALRLSGCPYPGHTELIARLCGDADVAMMLIGERLRVIHVTTHCSLAEAIRRIEPDRVYRCIELASDVLARAGIDRPRLAVAGLNPHAGEGGLFGDDEAVRIAPAIRRAKEAGFDVVGPVSPDSVFRKAAEGGWDAVVCMYHDQGHIPVKLIEFDRAVNVTAGLPIIRTSVDHGTAFDIAWKGTPDATNMVCAIRLAARMALQRDRKPLATAGG